MSRTPEKDKGKHILCLWGNPNKVQAVVMVKVVVKVEWSWPWLRSRGVPMQLQGCHVHYAGWPGPMFILREALKWDDGCVLQGTCPFLITMNSNTCKPC